MNLMVFDFDHTVVDDNTDTFVMKLCKDGFIPPEIRVSCQKGRWTEYMNNVFCYLHAKSNVTKSDYENVLKEIPLTANMLDLFLFVHEQKESTDCIIISDSNSWFIDVILTEHELSDVVSSIFTNQASFTANGLLQVTPHHEHNHQSCPKNMCKGQILKDFIAQQKDQGKLYNHVCYIGDGGNDLCPAMTLGSDDLLFARKGYALHNKIQSSKLTNSPLKCKVFVWENGLEILSELKDLGNLPLIIRSDCAND